MRVLGSAAKAERVAVLSAFAGRGLGRRLMDALERQAATAGLTSVELHSQEQVIPFYEKLGYVGEGALFVEAGILAPGDVQATAGSVAARPHCLA